MLHILLLLLKIIGCILLFLLCLIVIILAVVLLVPIRYRVSAEKYETIAAGGRVTWLGRLIEIVFHLDTGQEEDKRFHLRVRVAWHVFYDNLKPEKAGIKKDGTGKAKKQAKTEDKSRADKGQEKPESKAETGIEREKPESKAEAGIEREKPESKTESDAEPEQQKRKMEDEAASEQQQNEDKNVFKRIISAVVGFFKKIIRIPAAISDRLHHLAETIERLCGKKDKLMAIYHDEKNHRWIMKFTGRLKRLVIRLLPRIDRLYLHFGFDDPATTGQVLGALSILYCACEDRLALSPEFDRKIMEGEAALHGKIQLLPIVVFAVRSFLNKQFFSIVKQLKHI